MRRDSPRAVLSTGSAPKYKATAWKLLTKPFANGEVHRVRLLAQRRRLAATSNLHRRRRQRRWFGKAGPRPEDGATRGLGDRRHRPRFMDSGATIDDCVDRNARVCREERTRRPPGNRGWRGRRTPTQHASTAIDEPRAPPDRAPPDRRVASRWPLPHGPVARAVPWRAQIRSSSCFTKRLRMITRRFFPLDVFSSAFFFAKTTRLTSRPRWSSTCARSIALRSAACSGDSG